MKKIFYAIIIFAVAALPLAAVEHLWNIKDGAGSAVCKDSGSDPVNLKINSSGNVVWAREDDRDWFLNINGGSLSAPKAKMAYPDGVVINVKFSANLQNNYNKAWLPLITCGGNYKDGYSVWVNKDGSLLVSFPGTDSWFNIIKKQIRHLVDYELKVIQGNDRMQLVLNGRIILDKACKGKLQYKGGRTLTVGKTGSYEFYGNLYMLSVDKFNKDAFVKVVPEKKSAAARNSGEIIPVSGIADPAGTVVFSDFNCFSPAPVVKEAHDGNNWVFRSQSGFFAPAAPGSLHCPESVYAPVINYAPQLKGKYNIYLGVRATKYPNKFSFAVGSTENPYNIEVPAAVGKKHINTEILIASNVDMTGQMIYFLPGGNMFLGYVKFIPAANPRKKDYPVWKGVKITRGKIDHIAIERKRIENLLAQGYFKLCTYVDKTPLPKLHEKSVKRGFVLEKRNWMDLAFNVCKPKSDTGDIALSAAAAPGEFEPVSFIVYGLEDVGKLTLSVDPELAENGIACDITAVRSMIKRTTNYKGASEIMDAPQYLERTNSVELKKGIAKQFWITLKASENTKPGKYAGNLVQSSQKGKTLIPVNFTVYPFKLEDHDRLIGFFPGAEGFFDNKEQIRVMKDHNINLYFVSTKLELPVKKDKNGKLYIDYSYADIVDCMRDCGMKKLVVETDALSDRSRMMPDSKAVCTQLVQSLLSEAKKRSWGKIAFYGYDEALSRGKDRLERSIWANNMFRQLGVKTFNTHIWFKTSRPFQKEVDRLAPTISIFVNRYNTRNLWYVDDWSTMENTAEKSGRELWSYNIDNAICFAQPAMWRFATGWFFKTLGSKTRGQSVYAYNHTGNDPYNDLDGSCTDWMYDYPALGSHKGGFSINYEAIREGVDDLRYIATLEKRIKTARSMKINTAAAEKLLNDIKNSFDFTRHNKESVYLDSVFDKKWTDNGKLYCSGKYNLLNGWTLENYQSARDRIAEAIIALDKEIRR